MTRNVLTNPFDGKALRYQAAPAGFVLDAPDAALAPPQGYLRGMRLSPVDFRYPAPAAFIKKPPIPSQIPASKSQQAFRAPRRA